MRIAATALAVWLVFGGSAQAETVELKSGEKLEGSIILETEDTVVLEHAVLGRIEIPKSEIKPPDGVKPGVFGTTFLEGWTKSLSAGWSGSSGKSKDMNINASLLLNRQTERFRMNYVARYFLASSEGDTTDNQFDTRYMHDFLIPDQNFFPFLSPFYRYDAEQDWNHRLGLDGGMGYEFLKTDTWNVIGRAGTGVAQTLTDNRGKMCVPQDPNDPNSILLCEKIGDDPVRTEWNGLLALQLAWTMMEGMDLSWNTSYQPDFVDLPNFRLESRAEWKISVGYIEGLAFKLGGVYIYDAHETDKTRNDRRYYANLVYDF